MERVLILGAGFGGLELATRLSEEVPDAVEVTLIDQSDSFVFGYSKLDVMFGRQTPEAARLYYRDIVKPSVEFRQETMQSIDPVNRRVVTDRNTYDTDVLVVALGADVVPELTPGLVEGGNEFYSVAGAERLRDVLPTFDSRRRDHRVLGPFFKCPAAPYECAMMLHDLLDGARRARRDHDQGAHADGACRSRSRRKRRRRSSAGLEDARHRVLARDHGDEPRSRDERSRRCATAARSTTTSSSACPIHRAPAVVEESALAVDGWIPVDHTTFATSFPNVYAVGDVTSAPGAARRRDRRG